MNEAFRYLFFLLLFANYAQAEGGCPDGYFPIGGGNAGWQGCAPMNGGATQQPADPGPQWQKRWGAIAVDGSASSYGGVEGLSSQRRAEKAAIASCKKNGGKKCKVMGSYYNQCGALAWGNSEARAYRAPTTEDANSNALQSCSSVTSNCKIYYVGCSYPERVR